MKDKQARKVIDQLAAELGLQVDVWFNPDLVVGSTAGTLKDKLNHRMDTSDERIMALEKDLADFKESCKPVCKTCGQKIQDGLQQGQVETLAAGLKRGKKEKA